MVSQGECPLRYRIADLVIDVGLRSVRRGTSDIYLPKLSFDLFIALLAAAPNIVSNDELARSVWKGVLVSPESVTQRVKLLRDALGDDPGAPRYIVGLRRQGYRILPDTTVELAGLGPVPPLNGSAGHESASGSPESKSAFVGFGSIALLFAAVSLAGALAYLAIYSTRRTIHGPAQTGSPPSAAIPASSSLPPDSTAGDPLPPPHSVAVLPFLDMSEKKDQEYFSDGLTEELIDRLARVVHLKVIARTSSFQFKGKSEDVRSIAAKLGVANILEGSVRKSGTSLRITAQLIQASDGTYLWSHSYDERVTDLFKIQKNISEKVAQELESTLTADSSTSAKTPILDAYEALQKGNYFWQRNQTGDEERALAFYREATRRDPDYARAWAAVGYVYVSLGVGGSIAVSEARSKSMAALHRALSIDPGSAQAHGVMGKIYRDIDWDWKAAKEAFDRAASLEPNGGWGEDSGYLNWILTGDLDEQIVTLRQRLRRDPLDANILFDLGVAYRAEQRYQESADNFERALELNPRIAGGKSEYAATLLLLGQPEKALAAAQSDPDKSSRLSILPCVYWKLGRKAESSAALKELEADAAKSAYNIAGMYTCRGDKDRAFEWLERACRERQSGPSNTKFDPFLLDLHSDSRFRPLLVKLNLAD